MSDPGGNIPANTAYVADQYKDPSRLDARLRLYKLYEESGKPSFYRWVFDAMKFPSAAKVLEVGCGVGSFWVENAAKLPADATITLSDSAPAMLEAARSALPQAKYRFERIDVQAIPHPDASFDVVIANHMLYHIADRAQALSELRRVLRPGGTLYATTNAWTHLIELRALIERFVPEAHVLPARYLADAFDVENGARELQRVFGSLEVRTRRSTLVVTNAVHLIDYVRSTVPGDVAWAEEPLRAHVEWLIELQTTFYIALATGLFIARR